MKVMRNLSSVSKILQSYHVNQGVFMMQHHVKTGGFVLGLCLIVGLLGAAEIGPVLIQASPRWQEGKTDFFETFAQMPRAKTTPPRRCQTPRGETPGSDRSLIIPRNSSASSLASQIADSLDEDLLPQVLNNGRILDDKLEEKENFWVYGEHHRKNLLSELSKAVKKADEFFGKENPEVCRLLKAKINRVREILMSWNASGPTLLEYSSLKQMYSLLLEVHDCLVSKFDFVRDLISGNCCIEEKNGKTFLHYPKQQIIDCATENVIRVGDRWIDISNGLSMTPKLIHDLKLYRFDKAHIVLSDHAAAIDIIDRLDEQSIPMYICTIDDSLLIYKFLLAIGVLCYQSNSERFEDRRYEMRLPDGPWY